MNHTRNVVIKNVYYMLSYAFSSLQRREYQDIATEEFADAQNLFAAILTKGIGRQLKQGLYRQYTGRQEELSVVRGKIDMPDTITSRMVRKVTVACEFDELSENNLLNQILKSTAMLFLKDNAVDKKFHIQLKKQLLFFADIDRVDLKTIPWSALRFQRHNQSYRTLMGICRFIVEGLLFSTDRGHNKLASFVDEQHMSRLYERFILEYYRRHHPELNPKAAQVAWALDDGEQTMLPVMQTDITLQRGNVVLIIDAKYYSASTQSHFDTHKVHSGNLYQIFTYVKNRTAEFGDEPNEVSGMLLYARTQAGIQPDQSYRMSGNSISVKTLNLNQEFSEIAAQLDAIVEEFFDVSAPVI